MPSITVRNVPDEVHRALRIQAAQHGRSAEAEIREILTNAVKPESRVKLGTLLANLGQEVTLTDQEVAAIDAVRDRAPTKPLDFE